MKVYIKKHSAHAGKWIYEGYKNAWNSLGYDTLFYSDIKSLKKEEIRDSFIMAIDHDVLSEEEVEKLTLSKKTFLFVQSDCIPPPWGRHPNWKTRCSKEIIEKINKTNIQTWTFLETDKYFKSWNDIMYMPLGFDEHSYKTVEDKKFAFDVCFVGGWANNGFNEKKQIMLEVFSQFKDTSLKCGFFINKNLSHENECKIITNSKVCINIHDAYQRVLGLDTNERTFKTLGLNGALVSDKIACMKNLSLDISFYETSSEIIDKTYLYLEMPEADLEAVKIKNKENILNFHTYTKRVESFLNE
jgi:hypothetical protein